MWTCEFKKFEQFIIGGVRKLQCFLRSSDLVNRAWDVFVQSRYTWPGFRVTGIESCNDGQQKRFRSVFINIFPCP